MDGIEVKGAQTLFEIGPIAITETIISLIVVTALLAIAGVLLGRNLQKRPGKLQVLTEKGVSMLMGLVTDTMGQHNIGWVPYIGTIFLSSMLGSLIGLTGFLRSTTADLAVVLTWAVMTSVIIWYQSIKRNGFLGWLKGFTEPIVVALRNGCCAVDSVGAGRYAYRHSCPKEEAGRQDFRRCVWRVGTFGTADPF